MEPDLSKIIFLLKSFPRVLADGSHLHGIRKCGMNTPTFLIFVYLKICITDF